MMDEKRKIILGIDPGSRVSGFGVILVEGRKLTYIDSGIMKYDHIEKFTNRLGEVYSSCDSLISRYKPDEVAFEALIFVKNPTALMKLAQTRGAMIAAFTQKYKDKIFEYAPNLVKSSTTGYGHSDKEAIQKGLGLIFGKTDFETHDESDAIAVAVCHALNRGQTYVASSKSKSLKRGGNSLKLVAEAAARRQKA